jgi:hypothetical protein
MVELLRNFRWIDRVPADVIHPGGAISLITSHSALAESCRQAK